MKNKSFFILFSLFSLGFYTKTQAQHLTKKDIVEVNGVVLSSENKEAVSNAVISVKHQNRGVLSNGAGVFSLVCYPGDTLTFASVGFRTNQFVLPENFSGKYYNRTQLMVQDTFYLPETVIHSLPTGKAFIYAFKYWPVLPSPEDLALERFNKHDIDQLRSTLPMNGAENSSYFQQQQAIYGQYYGQVRSGVGLGSPLSWAQFFDAWKRGDLRRE